MHRVAVRLLGTSAADDACQEALLHVRFGARHFTPPTQGGADVAARAWLLRITANAAMMWARSERRRLARERHVVMPSSGSSTPHPEIEALREALAEMPEAQRLPVVLHFVGGQDVESVAAALGTSPGAARVRAHRDLASFRERLARTGVLVAAAAMCERLVAIEAPVPAATVARWNTLLTSTSTPAIATTAIFGGLGIMTKLAITCASIAVVGLLTFSSQTSAAEEQAGEPVKSTKAVENTKKPEENALKKEGMDAMAEGAKGVTAGTILSKENGKLTVQTADGNVLFMPHWRGGMPADGGGLDKEVLARLEAFKVGDKVRIEWTWSERRRIEKISKAE